MTTTLPDIDLASYSVIIRKIRLICLKDTYIFDKRYALLFKLFNRCTAIHTEVRRKMKGETALCFVECVTSLNNNNNFIFQPLKKQIILNLHK